MVKNPQHSKIQIGVIGAGACTPSEAEAAYQIGFQIAEQGGILVCGGLGGVMEAACRGAKSAGGVTVGVLPTARREDANPYVDIVVVTDMGHARNTIIAHSSDVLIAVGGEYGTLSEIALGLKIKRPVVSIHGGWDIRGVVMADTPDDAVRTAFMLLPR